jgi:hypothetical protein
MEMIGWSWIPTKDIMGMKALSPNISRYMTF